MRQATKLSKLLPVALIGVALAWAPVCAAQTAAELTERTSRPEVVRRVGKRMMCLCGCNQVLVECNHVGCSYSSEMIRKLERRVAANEPDDLILQAFVQEYGQRVLAEPPASGFNLAAWLMPIFALVVGTMIVGVALVRLRKPAPGAVERALEPRVASEVLERLRQQADRESGE
jgi:cytochrome c-type biogenesis protein CcmH/NrfF